MDHQRNVDLRAMLHDLEQAPMVVHADARHVRIAAAGVDHHEDLEAGDALFGERWNLFIDRRRRIEVPVDDGVAFIDGELLLEQFDAVGRRIDVRHRNAGGHAAGGALQSRAVDRVLVFETRFAALAVMGVHVDDARQHGEARGIDRLLRRRFVAWVVKTRDEAVLDADRRFRAALGGDQEAVLDQSVHISKLLRKRTTRPPP